METNNIYSELQEFLVPKTERKWTQYETKLLIDFYKSNINKLGTFKVKNQRALFELISNEFKKINIVVAPTNCLNRWKVLERKKFVDHQNQTVSEEAAEALGPVPADKVVDEVPEEVKSTGKLKLQIIKSRVMKKKITTLEAMRLDRKEYYTEKLKLEKEKIDQIKKRNALLEQQNQLLQEKNNILKEKIN
nr:unnamed protein product [Callosobruchus analis]